ncbi:putative NOT transcription complex subunit VIP2 [Hordeum vulgare]|nr:putative NOT transcription complex subunit VIP2 [Hordeum vulgare]
MLLAWCTGTLIRWRGGREDTSARTGTTEDLPLSFMEKNLMILARAIANGRRWRNSIPLLWDGETLLQRLAEIRAQVDGFYKALFSPSPRGGLCLAPSFWDPHQLVTDDENASLMAPFSEAEVLTAIKGMNHASAPGPDGLPVKFFQTFWDVIKPEVMALFEEFYVDAIDLSRLNYGIISLIPKVAGASDIR